MCNPPTSMVKQNLVAIDATVLAVMLSSHHDVFHKTGRILAKVWKAEMHHQVKFRTGRSKSCGDIAILSILKMVAIPYLRSFERIWTTMKSTVVCGLYHCAKFGCDWCSSFGNMKVWIFGAFGLKTSIHTPEVRVCGEYDPLMGSNINKTLKRHILPRVYDVWATKRENLPTGLTCKWLPNK